MNKKSGSLLHTFQIGLSFFVSSNKNVNEIILERESLILNLLPPGAEIAERGQIVNHSTVDCTFYIKHPAFNSEILIIEETAIYQPTADSNGFESFKFVSKIQFINSDGTPATFSYPS